MSQSEPAGVVETLRKALLQDHGYTVTSLAAELEITRPALSNVLNGNAELSIPLALRIERRFSLSARELLVQQLDAEIAKARAAAVTTAERSSQPHPSV